MIPFAVFSQKLGAPKAEGIYGGTIWHIDGFATSQDSSRVVITTKSANSAFYMDYSNGQSPSFSDWKPIPALSEKAGYGKELKYFQIHQESKRVLFLHEDRLKSAGFSNANDVRDIDTTTCLSFHLFDSKVIIVNRSGIYHGELDKVGNFTASTSGSLALPQIYNMPFIQINPQNKMLYIFCAENKGAGKPAQLWKSNKPLHQLDSNTTFQNLLGASTLNASVYWRSFGFSPSGRVFLGGSDFDTGPAKGKWIAYSDDETTWKQYSIGIDGGYGFTFDFTGDSAQYSVFYSRCYNDSMGDSLHWKNITSSTTHSNDRVSYVDPVNGDILFCVTDLGIGVSTESNRVLAEWNKGLQAVQVRDIDMTDDFSTAWVASKSGIWKASKYTTNPSWHYYAAGTPYYSVAMALNDTNHVYAGSDVVFKRHSNGDFKMVFDPSASPWPWPEHSDLEESVTFRALKVCPYDTTIVMAGMHCEDTMHGGLFISQNGGGTWNQVLIKASAPGFDVDVWDLVFNLEGNDTVAYVGVEYNSSTSARSVYRLVKNGMSWAVSQDMNGANTSVGYPISATIRDLDVSKTGDTLMAMGTDVSQSKPHAYYKVISGTNKWTPFTHSGLPSLNGSEGRCITMGIDTFYLAIENEIYLMPVGESSWSLGYSYPQGTEIYFLYYDDLFAGTETGMNGHRGTGGGAPLPVELVSFMANWADEGENVLLHWATAFEENNSHFIVQRAFNSLEWETIGTVNGHMNSYQQRDYEFVDHTLPHYLEQIEIYYRLVQVDVDGSESASDVVSVSRDGQQIAEVILFPNPLRGNAFTIRSSQEILGLEISDIHGRRYDRNHTTLNGQIAVELDKKPNPGLYNVTIRYSTYTVTKRLVVL